ncbi:serine protease gd-like [Arctopsyche grandis]|uniref:serine protease gd-like n=1 Tax=Arctopsyche grandis TaxID=121162 RepID=UPI00406D7EC7
MDLNEILVLITVLLKLAACQTPPPSPCPDVYYYESDGYKWYGVIEAPNPPPYGSQMTVKVRMSIKAQLATDYVGKIELGEKRSMILERIEKKWPIKYKVHFPLPIPLPDMVSIVFDNRLICSGPVSVGRLVTAIDLEHTLHSGESALKNSPQDKLVYSKPIPLKKDSSVENRFDAPETTTINFKPKPPQPSNYNPLLHDHGICGTTSSINPLVVGGDATSKEDWPWLVAIFMKRIRGLDFVCAGNLVSDRVVVTAAHCVKTKNRTDVLPNQIVVRLGVYNLQDWTEETAVTKSVRSVKTRKDYDEGVILNADIAVLVMMQAVSFTNYVRPVCLWKGSTDQGQVYGKIATVVGWGKDERGTIITPEPRVARIPIVSTEKCRSSRPEFIQLTSERTLCAGDKDGSGPCNGDSGGGLYMRQGNRWALRGIVSNSLRDPDTNGCDLNEYVVYTDAAKYIGWIGDV